MTKRLGIKALLAASIGIGCMGAAHAADTAPVVAGNIHFNTSSLKDSGSYDRFIVRYREGSTERTSQLAAVQNVQAAVARAGKSRATLSTRAPTVNYKRKLATGGSLLTTSRKLNKAEATAFIQAIAQDPAVEHVAPDVRRRAIGMRATAVPTSFTPNDSYFARYQSDYLPADGAATAYNGVANDGGANITGAWDVADGTGVTIAVLDTGIVRHADVDTSLADAGYDFIVDHFVSGRTVDGRVPGGWDTGDWTTEEPWLSECTDDDYPPQSSSWHGTHVASASGAELTNNGSWAAGIAYGAKVLPVRVLGHCGGYDSDINDAIVWAAGGEVDGVPTNQHPAKVINLSLGGGGACSASDDSAIAIAKANALGAVVVVAAGNDGSDVKNYSPASCPGAITVASTGYTSKLAFYSNYNGSGGNIIALAAPGGGLYKNDGSSGQQMNPEGIMWQAWNKGLTTPQASPGGDTLGGMVGTSQATPHVTGAVALMQSARIAAELPLLTPAEVLGILKSTAHTPKVTPSSSKGIGAGILDAGAAVAAAVVYGGDGGDGGGDDPGDGGGDDGDQAVELTNGTALGGQSGAADGELLYKLEVPQGALGLVLRTFGGTGDVSVFVKIDGEPSATDNNYKSVHVGNSESVAVPRPAAGTYYVKVVGVKAFSGLSVQGNFVNPQPPI